MGIRWVSGKTTWKTEKGDKKQPGESIGDVLRKDKNKGSIYFLVDFFIKGNFDVGEDW